MPPEKFLWKLFDCFANDFQFANYGTHCFVISKKGIVIHPGGERFDTFNRIEDILEI
jgi:hypothetical protein